MSEPIGPRPTKRRRNYAAEKPGKDRYYVTQRGRAGDLIRNARRRALARGGQCVIDLDFVLAGMRRGCAVTGLPFVLTIVPHFHAHPLAPSLDRIDTANPNYSPENTRVVCHAVNVGLGEWGLDSYLAIAARALGVPNHSYGATLARLQETI